MASSGPRCSARDLIDTLTGSGRDALREFIARQRWFAAKTRGIAAVRVEDWAALRERPARLLLLVAVDGERYFVPLAATPAPPPDARAAVAAVGAETIVDAHWDPEFGRDLLAAIAAGRVLHGSAGRFLPRPLEPWIGPSEQELGAVAVRCLGGEQSNTSILYDRRLILKSIRRPSRGINPDLEMTYFLTRQARFPDVAPLAGWLEYADHGDEPTTIALLQRFIENSGDGWTHALGRLHALCEQLERDPPPTEATAGWLEERPAALIEDLRGLGTVTGGLHAALASDPSLRAFCPEPVTRQDTARWGASILQSLDTLLADLDRRGSASVEPILATLRAARGRLERTIGHLPLLVDGSTHKIRCHGDYHLGQVLKSGAGFVVIDFEGEPARPLEERRAKQAPVRDVAGMLRSFDYAVHSVLADRPVAARARLLPWLEQWQRLARRAFLHGYTAAVAKSPVRLVPAADNDLVRCCAVFELDKACYEMRYELNHRPDWVSIPLAGISRLLDTSP